MLKSINKTESNSVRIYFDEAPIDTPDGISVAAAILTTSDSAFRTTPVSNAPRKPYCMMGVCFDCLVTIDGEANRQACMVQVKENMHVSSQQGAHQILQHQDS